MIAMPQMQPFGAGMGPAAGGDMQPESFQQAIQMRAREDAMRMGLTRRAGMQVQGSLQGAATGLGTIAGKQIGTTLGRIAFQSLSAPAVESAASQVGPELGKSVLDSTGSSLLSGASNVVSLAGAGYAAYQGHQDAAESLHALNQAVADGALTKSQEEEARQHLFNAAMVKGGLGSGIGALGGLASGSIPGAIIGAAAGGYGGVKQAWSLYDDPQSAGKAFLNFAKNPFKR